MSDNSDGASPWFALLVGGLIVAVGVVVYFFYASATHDSVSAPIKVEMKLPKPPDLPQGPSLPPPPIPVPK
jgi:hypothetical protein